MSPQAKRVVTQERRRGSGHCKDKMAQPRIGETLEEAEYQELGYSHQDWWLLVPRGRFKHHAQLQEPA